MNNHTNRLFAISCVLCAKPNLTRQRGEGTLPRCISGYRCDPERSWFDRPLPGAFAVWITPSREICSIFRIVPPRCLLSCHSTSFKAPGSQVAGPKQHHDSSRKLAHLGSKIAVIRSGERDVNYRDRPVSTIPIDHRRRGGIARPIRKSAGCVCATRTRQTASQCQVAVHNEEEMAERRQAPKVGRPLPDILRDLEQRRMKYEVLWDRRAEAVRATFGSRVAASRSAAMPSHRRGPRSGIRRCLARALLKSRFFWG